MSNQQTDTSKANILIIDDTAHVLRLLSAMLLKQGYEVQTANSGLEALEAVRTTPPT
jgi:CheY-like chemotaxis protein